MIDSIYMESGRCILRPLKETDDIDLFDFLGDKDVFKYIPYDPYPSLDDVKDSIVNNYRKRIIDGIAYEFGIEFKESKSIIGTCGFIVIDGDLGVLGYLLHKDYWGLGIMTEVVNEIIEFGFDMLKLDTIVGYCMVDNNASKNVLLKTGFTHISDATMHVEGNAYEMSNYILKLKEYSKQPE